MSAVFNQKEGNARRQVWKNTGQKKTWEEDEKAYDGEIYMMLIKFNWTAEGKGKMPLVNWSIHHSIKLQTLTDWSLR